MFVWSCQKRSDARFEPTKTPDKDFSGENERAKMQQRSEK
jgi:hypothetical protein